MKKTIGTRYCVICNSPYESSQVRERCCSLKCGHELRRRNFAEKAERALGEPLKEGITRRLDSGMTLQAITHDCGLSDTRALLRIMDQLSIPRRSPSESVRLQWANNEQRRASFGQTISEWKRNNPAAAMAHSLIGNLALQNTSPTSIERKMMDALDRAGIAYEFQYVVGDKFLCDLAFPAARLIVECDGSYWHRTPKQRRRDAGKDAYLQACGYTVLRFSDKQIERDVDACIQAIASLIQPPGKNF